MMTSDLGADRPAKADFTRWGLCALAVLGLHGAAMLWLRDIRPTEIGLTAPAPAILLELAPEPVAPPAAVEPPPPAAEPPPPEAAPVVASEPPPPEPAPPPPQEEPAPPPEAVLPVPKPPPVKRPPPPRRVVHHETPPVVQPVAPPVSAPPLPAAPVRAAPPPGALVARWETTVAAYIARFKQYPVAAQRRGDEGVALVHFVVDRAGNISSVVLVHSSGHPELDREATAWIARAQPVPPPPPEIAQSRIELVVPLRFALH